MVNYMGEGVLFDIKQRILKLWVCAHLVLSWVIQSQVDSFKKL